MARFGIRACIQVGLLIAKATGPGLSRGDGLGSMMRVGDLLHSTMGAGFLLVIVGDGYQGRQAFVPYMLRHWSPGLAAYQSGLAAELLGCR